MVIKSINDIIRNDIYNFFDKYLLRGKTIDEIAEMFSKYIYSLEPNKLSDFSFSSEYNRMNLIRVIYLDALKMTTYRHKVGLVDDEELIFFNNLTSLDGDADIASEISFDPALLNEMIIDCYRFSSYNMFSKIMIFKSLTSDEQLYLSKTYSNHLIDSFIYGKKITIDDLNNYLSDYIIHQKKYIGEIMNDNNLSIVSNFIKVLMNEDGSDSFDLLIDLIKIDYSVCKFLYKNNVSNEVSLNHIDLYENYSMEDILTKFFYDEVFLMDTVNMYLILHVDKKYGDIILPDDILQSDDIKKLEKKLIIDF